MVKVFIYFKHGSRWCYIGPVGSVDVDELLRDVELESYHNLTTKFTEYLSKVLGEARLRLGAQLIIGLALTVSAYGLATGGARYGSIVLTLTGLSALLFTSLLATYESSSAKGVRYPLLSKLIIRGYIWYFTALVAVLDVIILISLPLTSP